MRKALAKQVHGHLGQQGCIEGIGAVARIVGCMRSFANDPVSILLVGIGRRDQGILVLVPGSPCMGRKKHIDVFQQASS